MLQKYSKKLTLLGMLLFIIAIIMTFYSTGISKTETPFLSYIYILLFAAIIVFLIEKNTDHVLSGGKFLLWFFAVYSLWLLVAPYTSTWFDMSRFSTWVLFLTPLSFYISSYLKPEKGLVKLLLVAYFCFGMFLFCWSILHLIVTVQRPEGPTHDANVFAGLLLFFIIPATVFWLVTKFETPKQKRVSDCLLLYLVFGFFGFFAPNSRSATGALLIVGILLLLKIYRSGFSIRPKKLIVVIVLILISINVVSYFSNFSSLTRNLGSDASFQLRLEMWKTGLEIYKNNDHLTGIGFSQFPEFYARNRPSSDLSTAGFHVHNDYVEFLIEGGLIQLSFFVILAFFIIYHYFRLFVPVSGVENKEKNLKAFVFLSMCCIYFIQAVVNFIFFNAPNAVLLGVLLGCFNQLAFENSYELTLNKKSKIIIGIISTITIFCMLLSMHVLLYFYYLPSDLSGKKYTQLFKQSNRLSKILPRTLALPHFNLKYSLRNIAKADYRGNFDNDLEYINTELTRAIRNKNFDADTVKFLANYSNKHPVIYRKVAKQFPGQRYFNLSTEELYLLSIEYNPLIFSSILELRDIYKERGEKLKAYELLRDKMIKAPNFRLFLSPFQASALNDAMQEAVELGLHEEAEEYAMLVLKTAPCFQTALDIMKLEKPESCK